MTYASRPRHFHPWAIVAFAWLAVVALFFAPVLFGGKVLAPLDILDHLMLPWSDGSGGFGVKNAHVYDAISQYIPYDWAVFRSFRETGDIGWNPCEHGGYALLENTMLCPGDWRHHLYRFLDFWTAWDMGIVLQFAIAGLGVLLMLRAEGLPPWAALVAAISFAFYSQHVLWIYHRWVLGATCWLPWVIWAVRRAVRRGRVVDLWSVLFVALAFRGGHLQACLFTASLLGCLFVSDCRDALLRSSPLDVRRVFLTYFATTVITAVFSLNLFANTIPPWMAGCKRMPFRSFSATLRLLPTLATSMFPTLLGTSSTLDGFRTLGSDLFDIKFAGAIPLLLALFALRRSEAPFPAKLLFVVGIVIPFTPLTTWVYSRFSVLFGLGCAWLAAWSLPRLETVVSRRSWRNVAKGFAVVLGLWLVASVSVACCLPELDTMLHRFVEQSMSDGKTIRLPWMLARADSFLRSSLLWRGNHIVNWISLLAGTVCLSVLSGGKSGSVQRQLMLRLSVVVCVMVEMLLFFQSWVVFSPRPSGRDAPFETPDWMAEMRRLTEGKGFLHVEKGAFDSFQLNTPSAYGLRQAEGYETITPRHPAYPPEAKRPADATAWAEAGVSHWFSHDPEAPAPGPGWEPILRHGAFSLFENTSFDSLFHAHLADGRLVPLDNLASRSDERRFVLPSGTRSVTLSESYHPKWRAEIVNGTNLPPVSVQLIPSKLRTMQVLLPTPSQEGDTLRLKFHPRRLWGMRSSDHVSTTRLKAASPARGCGLPTASRKWVLPVPTISAANHFFSELSR